jgi:hypothetical protein
VRVRECVREGVLERVSGRVGFQFLIVLF